MRIAAEDANGRPAVIHIKAANPLDDHYGLGCLGAAAGAVAIHNAATKWNKALPRGHRGRWFMNRASRGRRFHPNNSNGCEPNWIIAFPAQAMPGGRCCWRAA